MNNHQQMQQQRVAIPAVNLTMWGPRAEYHRLRHVTKQGRYPFDCGIDLYPTEGPYETTRLSSKVTRINVGTGVSIMFQPGSFGMITDRSSTPVHLYGATTFGGVIDATYTGEMKVHIHVPSSLDDERSLVDLTKAAIETCCRDHIAIAQVIPMPYYTPIFVMAKEKPRVEPGRGDAGYGSTDGMEPSRIIKI